jgi:hypothetical protein
MRVVIHTLIVILENLIGLSDLLPASWSFGVVRQELRAVLECESLVRSGLCQRVVQDH